MDDLYTTFAQDFSDTRKRPWEGWLTLIDDLKKYQPLNLLDVGCGNGRFLDFLIEQKIQYDAYLGIDNSKELLEIAKKKNLPRAEFKEQDVEVTAIDQIPKPQTPNPTAHSPQLNAICMFGLMHHIRTFRVRKQLIDDAITLIKNKGIIIITFWQFKDDESFFNSHVVKIEGSDLQRNDYILRFGKEATRFCHYVDDQELDLLMQDVPANITRNIFFADGKNKKMNRYLILESK